MSSFKTFGSGDHARWLDLVQRAASSYCHHHPGYHALDEAERGGSARLFVAQDSDGFIALPLMVHPVPGASIATHRSAPRDATSIYGYAGPFASENPSPGLIETFQTGLRKALAESGVVSVFSALHPLASSAHLVAGLGEVVELGSTVALDLGLEDERRRAGYRANHRRDLRRLERDGATVREDVERLEIDRFVDLYRATMERLDATPRYRFEDTYFRTRLALEEPRPRLFTCRLAEEVICAGTFTHHAEVVEYHFSGTAAAFHGRAPLKLLLDRVASWGRARGARWLHLGGGLGGKEDSLFHFKLGFGGSVRPFRAWRWVVDRDAYAGLCAEAGHPSAEAAGVDFFPAYRRPVS